MVKLGNEILAPPEIRDKEFHKVASFPKSYLRYTLLIWKSVRHLTLQSYVDDTSTSRSKKEVEKVKVNLEEDVTNILHFMASNRLVANPSKTDSMLLSNKTRDTNRKIKVGNAEIQEVKSSKLLRITMDNDQKWTRYFWGKKGLLQFLKQRLFAIRRISNHIPKN